MAPLEPQEKDFDWPSQAQMAFVPPEGDCLRAALPRLELLYDLPLLLSSAVAQPLAALLPYGCGTPLAGAALESERKCSVITCYRWHNIAASAAKPPRQTIASLYKSKVGGNCVRLTNRRQSDSENRSRPNRIEELNAATPRAGISIPEAPRSFKIETANLNAFLLGFQRGYSLSRKRISPLSRTPARPQGICKHIMLAITPNTGYNILSFCLPHSRREERNGSYG